MKLFGGGNKQIAEKTDSLEPHPPAPAHHPPPEPPRPAYGIQNAIVLMRTLPVDQNPELVVTVIKTTLESLKVRVADIIDDATRRQQEIETRAANLKQQIMDFEREIATRKEEIGRLEADHAETTTVKGRLELAENGPPGQLHAAPRPTIAAPPPPTQFAPKQ
ncbi:MAG: hypothetical protein ABMA64_05200 [Myxococcota bacterium]